MIDRSKAIALVNKIFDELEDPEFKVGDWVTYKFPYDEDIIVEYEGTESITYYEPDGGRAEAKPVLWNPQRNEWCVFWDKEPDVYMIAKYATTDGTGIMFIRENYDYVAPLEFCNDIKGLV